MGVDILYVSIPFEAAVRYASNAAEISISTRQAVKEPFISILVELRSAAGTQYREYPIILDPAFVVENRPLKQNRDNRRLAEVAVDPVSTHSVGVARVESGRNLSGRNGQESSGKNDSVKVQRGQTLSGIASALSRESDVSLEELRRWLFAQNPHAFIAGDINRLRAGVHLTVPTSGQAVAQSDPLPLQAGRVTLGAADKQDALWETIDSLSRENRTLEQQLASGLGSGQYIETLESLVQLQQEQIDRLTRLVNSDSLEAQSDFGPGSRLVDGPENVGLQLIGSNFLDKDEGAEETTHSHQEISLASIVPDLQSGQVLPSYRGVWLAGVGILVLFGGMFLYRRKQYSQRISGITSRPPGASISSESEPLVINYRQVTGDSVNGIAEAATQKACLSAGRSVEELTLPTNEKVEFFEASESALEGFTQEVSVGLSVGLKGRSDDEVRNSIAAKISLYPGYDQCQNEPTFEVDDWDYPRDDLDSAIEQAHLFCEFKQFKSAREVLEPLTGIDDVRLYEALAKIEIQEIESRKLNRS